MIFFKLQYFFYVFSIRFFYRQTLYFLLFSACMFPACFQFLMCFLWNYKSIIQMYCAVSFSLRKPSFSFYETVPLFVFSIFSQFSFHPNWSHIPVKSNGIQSFTAKWFNCFPRNTEQTEKTNILLLLNSLCKTVELRLISYANPLHMVGNEKIALNKNAIKCDCNWIRGEGEQIDVKLERIDKISFIFAKEIKCI